MRRRGVIAGLAVLAATWQAKAQQKARVYRIAHVAPSTPVAEMGENNPNPYLARAYRVFFDELHRLGHVETQNLIVELFGALATDVVGREPACGELRWVAAERHDKFRRAA